MKKLFLAFVLTGLVGSASVTTVCAMSHSKVVLTGGEEDKDKKKDKKKCKKDGKCCSKEGTASTSGEKKSCEMKSSGGCNHGAAKTTETKTDSKPAETK